MRYHFNVTRGVEYQDNDGVDLASQALAWHAATTAFAEMLKDVDGRVKLGQPWEMEVTDDEGIVFSLSFDSRSQRP
jgi:hypothetical protein